MKLTVEQLRHIIKEEVQNITEARASVSLGAALDSGTLQGIGKAGLMSALSALELSDLKLLNNAVFSAMNKKESEMTRSKIGAAAAKMTPSFLSKKIERSLDSYNWDWVGEFGTDKYNATLEAIEAIKTGASRDFERDLSYITSDVSSDTFRKMSRPAAVKAQKNATANMQKLVSELQ